MNGFYHMAIGLVTALPFALHAGEAGTIRLGHFPNITHAQAVLARATGEYEKSIGVPIHWTSFNAGPTAIESLLMGAIDATYVGPNPAINGHVKTGGRDVRIVAGSASGGAALVIRADAGIASEKDFDGKTVGTPQLGNTQDVAARVWFQSKGHALKEKGGSLAILPLSNPDQLLLFRKRQIDAAWTIEPWVSRLEQEGNGRVFLEERNLWPDGRYVTTHLVVRTDFLKKSPTLVKKLLEAHVEITRKINGERDLMGSVINREIGKLTGKPLPDAVFQSAWKRVEITWDPVAPSLYKSAEDAFHAGFFRQPPDLSRIYDLSLINGVLREKGLPEIPQAGSGK